VFIEVPLTNRDGAFSRQQGISAAESQPSPELMRAGRFGLRRSNRFQGRGLATSPLDPVLDSRDTKMLRA
jgi:hypothetical protein